MQLSGKRKSECRRCELPQSKPSGFASSLWEGAFGVAVGQKPPSLREVARRSRDGRSEPQGLEKLELMKKALMQEYFG